METGYVDNVLDYSKIPNGNHEVKMKQGDRLDSDNDIKNTLVSHLGFYFEQ